VSQVGKVIFPRQNFCTRGGKNDNKPKLNLFRDNKKIFANYSKFCKFYSGANIGLFLIILYDEQ